MSITSVIVIDHLSDLSGVVPEVAEPPRKVIRLVVLLVHLVAEPCGKQSEELADVLAVGVHEGEGRDHSELHRGIFTAKPAAGKAMRLFSFSLLVIEYLNLSSWLLLRAHYSKRERTNSMRSSLRASVLILPAP
jgi:hypothetical protein